MLAGNTPCDLTASQDLSSDHKAAGGGVLPEHRLRLSPTVTTADESAADTVCAEQSGGTVLRPF